MCWIPKTDASWSVRFDENKVAKTNRVKIECYFSLDIVGAYSADDNEKIYDTVLRSSRGVKEDIWQKKYLNKGKDSSS